MPNEIRADMLKVKRMISDVEIVIGKRDGETELVNKLIDAENLLTYCMSRLENAVVPPCKVGDTVQAISRSGRLYEYTVNGIHQFEDKHFMFGGYRICKDGKKVNPTWQDYEIGKIVFVGDNAKEAAEKALKEGIENVQSKTQE
ncbi:MAG: hypothetical protein IKJ41_10890 [Clostridia bacterium]|nr:hypothetical protein [Clostridia bacterium]